MLHLAEGGDNALFRWWFDQATSRGVPFDVIGASYYPYWHGPLSGLQANLNDMATRYNKDVVVVEIAYGFTLAADDSEPNIFNSSLAQAGGFPATPQGQADAFRAVINVVRTSPTDGDSASSTGSRRGRRGPGPAGTRPTRTRATAGRTRRCSTTTTGPCRRCGCSTASSRAEVCNLQQSCKSDSLTSIAYLPTVTGKALS